jgi:hypothetical protein
MDQIPNNRSSDPDSRSRVLGRQRAERENVRKFN